MYHFDNTKTWEVTKSIGKRVLKLSRKLGEKQIEYRSTFLLLFLAFKLKNQNHIRKYSKLIQRLKDSKNV